MPFKSKLITAFGGELMGQSVLQFGGKALELSSLWPDSTVPRGMKGPAFFFVSGLNRYLTSHVDTNSERGHIMLRGLLNKLRQRVVRSLPLSFYHGPGSVFSKSRSATRRRQHRGIQLSLIPPILALEDRIMLAGLVVTNTLDDGSTGSLRWAVGQANSNGVADTITFDATVFATPQTITLTGGQLELTDSAKTTITGPTAALTVSGNDVSRV